MGLRIGTESHLAYLWYSRYTQ